jgi:hypothetical protein
MQKGPVNTTYITYLSHLATIVYAASALLIGSSQLTREWPYLVVHLLGPTYGGARLRQAPASGDDDRFIEQHALPWTASAGQLVCPN